MNVSGTREVCLSRAKSWIRETSVLGPLAHLAHGRLIPQVIHVPVRIKNLGAVAPELALGCAHEGHARTDQLLVLTVDVIHLNRSGDLLAGERALRSDKEDRQARSSFDPDGSIKLTFEREAEFPDIPIARSLHIRNGQKQVAHLRVRRRVIHSHARSSSYEVSENPTLCDGPQALLGPMLSQRALEAANGEVHGALVNGLPIEAHTVAAEQGLGSTSCVSAGGKERVVRDAGQEGHLD